MPRCGPITESGKNRSKLNSLRHGLTSLEFMPCKKEECFFIDACQCSVVLGELYNKVAIGSPCPMEIYYYSWSVDRYSTALGKEQSEERKEDLHQLVLAELRLRRACQALAVCPQPGRLVPGPIPGYLRPAQSLYMRYKFEAQKHWHECLARLFPSYTLPEAWDDAT